jgi:head-tail adaptor
MKAGRRDRRVEIQRKTRTAGFMKAGQGSWATIATVWAEVQDVLPSRSEKLSEGLDIARRPARVRMLYRSDITADMRLKMGDRIMEIVAGPVEIGRRDGLEMMVVDYTTRGEAP